MPGRSGTCGGSDSAASQGAPGQAMIATIAWPAWTPVRLSLAGSAWQPPDGQVAAASAAALTAMVSAAAASSSQPVLARVRSLVHSACSASFPYLACLRRRGRLPIRVRLSPAAGRLTRRAGAAGRAPRPRPAPGTRTAPRTRPTAPAGSSQQVGCSSPGTW